MPLSSHLCHFWSFDHHDVTLLAHLFLVVPLYEMMALLYLFVVLAQMSELSKATLAMTHELIHEKRLMMQL